MNKYLPRKNFDYINVIIPYLIIPFLIWVTYFLSSNNFGLYEDDYHRIPPIMWMNKNELWDLFMKTIFAQGRPFHDGLIFVFSLIGFKLNGLQGIYFIGYLIVTINCILFYFFLIKISDNDIFIITGTLAFCLYPADTTRTFLTHSLGLQTSLTFFLIASHLYLSHRKNLSYLVIILCLFCYETFFLLFLPIPFLQIDKKQTLTKDFISHSTILSTQLILVAIVRKLTGESRVSEMDLGTTIITIMKQIIIGPMVSMKMYLYRSFQAFSTLTIQSFLIWFIGFVTIFLVIFYYYKREKLSEKILIDSEKKVYFNDLIRLISVSIAMLLLAYPLTFTVNAMDINGRNSRVHSAAIVGASILIGCLCALIFYVAKNYLFKNVAIAIIASGFSLLIIFGINVQLDYQKSWAYQRQFWTDVVNLCPDLEENTVILVEGNLPTVTQIYPFEWTISSILPNMYEFPTEWEFQPTLYPLEPEWRSKIWDNGKLALNNHNGAIYRAIYVYYSWKEERLMDSSDVILLKIDQDKLERINTPIIINQKNVSFKSNKFIQKNEFKTRPLYDYLVKKRINLS